jgi:hypothetical protein
MERRGLDGAAPPLDCVTDNQAEGRAAQSGGVASPQGLAARAAGGLCWLEVS